jgi:hypothetical protein
MKKLLLSLPLPLLCFATTFAVAQDIETDRPDKTETVSTVPKGRFQSESGVTHTQVQRGESESMLPETLWKFGLNNKLELRLITELEYFKYADSSAYGLEPVKIGLKVNLWEEKGIIPETSLLVHVALPKIASKKLQTMYVAPEIRLLFENEIADIVEIGYNVGAEWDGLSAEPVFVYTFSPDFTITDRLESYIEAFGYMPQQGRADHWIDGGFKYLITKDIQVDISGGYELTGRQHYHSYFESLGFSFRI